MIEAGRFCIFGDWDTAPTPAGKLRIVLPPLGHVYGGGWQSTTQAALLALEQHVTPDCTFLDIGTGSGILCVAAKLLGAGRCIATELDADALAAAKRTFAANNVRVDLRAGTFADEHADLAVISISTSFAKEHRHKIKAKKVIVVHDDSSIEML